MALEATLPWPPSVNHYWAARGNARYLSPRARAWREEASWRLRAARNGRGRITRRDYVLSVIAELARR